MNKENLTTTDIATLKDFAAKSMIKECIIILREKSVLVLQNDCCIDLNAIKRMITHEL